jgi:hypothetical protein
MVEDTGASMKELVERMGGPEETEEQVDAKVDALEQLQDMVDKIDYAIALHVYAKGFLPLFNMVEETKHDSIRMNAALLAAMCMRNNDKAQMWALEAGGLATLMKAYTNQAHPTNVRKALLSAVSSLVQNCPVGEKAFLVSGGVAALSSDVQSIARGIKVKALFTMQWLLACSSDARSTAAVDAALIESLQASVDDEDDEIAELSALCLKSLVGEKSDAVCKCVEGGTLKIKIEQRLNVGAVASGDAETTKSALTDLLSLLA